MKTTYTSTNSGGSWWLGDEHWLALEKAGWVVKWVKDEPQDSIRNRDGSGRWLGGLAMEASREGLGLDDAIKEWESVVGLSAYDPGCSCCGQPHYFTEYSDDDRWVACGPDVFYENEEDE